MIQEETVIRKIDNGILIADFMELNVVIMHTATHPNGELMTMTEGHMGYEELKYHSSWDWLIPVVEKIVSLGYNVENVMTPNYKTCRIYGKVNNQSFCVVKEEMYQAVIEFIKLYRNQANET